MRTPANRRGRCYMCLYFQCSEVDGAKWQVPEEMFLSQFQIEPLLHVAADRFLPIVLKKLVILALMFCVIPFSHADNAAPASGTAQGQKPANSTTSAAVQEHRGSNFQQDGSPNQTTNEPKAVRVILPAKDNYDKATFWISVILAIVGTGGIVVAVLTMRKIERQTKATEESVKAAINAERPWITCKPPILAPDIVPEWEKGDPLPHPGLYWHWCPITIKNVGRTVALIDEIVACYRHIAVDPFTLEKTPRYEFPERLNGRILAPEDSFDISVPLRGGGTLSKKEVSSIKARDSYLYAWGSVRYRDGHGESHETAFGYVYHFPQGGMINFEKAGFRVAGPPDYNRAT
jgi:hypothetical protein